MTNKITTWTVPKTFSYFNPVGIRYDSDYYDFTFVGIEGDDLTVTVEMYVCVTPANMVNPPQFPDWVLIETATSRNGRPVTLSGRFSDLW